MASEHDAWPMAAWGVSCTEIVCTGLAHDCMKEGVVGAEAVEETVDTARPAEMAHTAQIQTRFQVTRRYEFNVGRQLVVSATHLCVA